MSSFDQEERDLRTVALQNAASILAARQKAERDLVAANEALERKTEELARSNARMRATLESTTDAIVATDLDGAFTDFNEQLLKLWRLPPILLAERRRDEIRAHIRAQLVDPAGFTARLQEITRQAAPETFDTIELLDGRVIERHSRLQLAEDRPIGRVWTFRDITHHRRAAAELREETRTLELLNATGTAIAANLDLQSLLQSVTDAATKLSGAKFGAFFLTTQNTDGAALMLYTLSGAPREAFEKFGHPRATPIFRPTFEGAPPLRIDDVLQDPRYGQMPPHHGMPPGHLAVRSFLSVPVFSRTGAVLGGLFFGHPEPGVFTARAERLIVGVAAQAGIAIDNARLYEAAQREIAERVRTEERLRDSETRLRVSLETAALGTWELDLATRTVALDARCQVVFGLTDTPTLELESFLGLVHPEEIGQRRQAILEVIAGVRDRYDIEFRLAENNRWVRASAKSVRDERNEIVRVIGAVLDITDLMKARATTEERRRELEKIVEERTASLQTAVAQMEEFSYSVSHDLRAPLRSIQAYAQAIIEDFGGQLGAEAIEYLQRIANAGSRMDRLTRDVLTYSTIARGDAPMAAIPLERIVADAIEQYAPAESAAGQVTMARPMPPILGHEPLLVQVISNLLANALKFVPAGVTPQVRIRTEVEGPQVRLWVEDNGIGIEPEHQARIWRMFERVHPKEKYDGTGIGLAIVRKAVERMHGTLGVESDGKHGSRFWILLRAA